MGGFFSSLFTEMGARRRRLRAALGDRGQAMVEFLVLGGLLLGSLGLFVRAWMPAAAPWGFALPVVFVIAWTAQPPPAQEEEIWTPPESSVSVDISP